MIKIIDNNIKLLIVNIPELHEVNNYPFKIATDFVSNISRSNNVPFIDLLEVVKDQDPKSLWVSAEDSHSNIKCDKLFAERILTELMKLN